MENKKLIAEMSAEEKKLKAEEIFNDFNKRYFPIDMPEHITKLRTQLQEVPHYYHTCLANVQISWKELLNRYAKLVIILIINVI